MQEVPLRFAVAFFCVLATVATAAAEQRYALVLSGASGGPKCGADGRVAQRHSDRTRRSLWFHC